MGLNKSKGLWATTCNLENGDNSLPQFPLILPLPTHPFRTQTTSQPFLCHLKHPSRPLFSWLTPTSLSSPTLLRTTMWSKTSFAGLEALLLLWFQNVSSILLFVLNEAHKLSKVLSSFWAVFYELQWNVTQLTTRSTISCWQSVIRSGSWSSQPCLHQLHVLITPFPGSHSLHLAFGSWIYPHHTLPFTFPLINRFDRCLGLLALGLMAGRHRFTSHGVITLTI